MPNKPKPEPTNYQAIIRRLKDAIDKAGGPSVVAKASGVPASTLSEYLNNGAEARFTRFVALAKAADVSLDWLAFGDERLARIQAMPLLQANILDAPAHFWGLFVILRSCQEYHQQMRLKPTLAEVFEWISGSYEKAMAFPDTRIEFKDPKDVAK